jgi:hypothetical protein
VLLFLVLIVSGIRNGVGDRIVDGPVDGYWLRHRNRMWQRHRLAQIQRHLLRKLHGNRLLNLHRHVMWNFHYLRDWYRNRMVHWYRHWYVVWYLQIARPEDATFTINSHCHIVIPLDCIDERRS